jgi:predicted AlkP superfamily pyrophosphatase or phosphodiesterase
MSAPIIPRLLPRIVATLALLLTSCASITPPTVAEKPVPLLLISIDGLRAADVDTMPTLKAMGETGVRAEAMRPSYPSLTFPNHYTLVTGLRPDHHGIVNNTMRDAQLGSFSLSNRDAVGDGRWWDGGEPIWVGAHNAGLRSATMFWPGSEAEVRGVRPDYWQVFDAKITPTQRVEQVLAWLDLPPDQRPDVMTLYFDQVDHDEHGYGPDSAQADAARAQIDAALAQLLAGLQARGPAGRINLIIVSDHGMAAVTPGRMLAMEDMLPLDKVQVVSGGQVVGVEPRAGDEAAFNADIAPQLLGRHEQYECWRKADLPARWHYGTHVRIPAIVCQMDEGWDAVSRRIVADRGDNGTRGSHGYDPALTSMQAVFVASGPAFRNGVRLPAFDNVDVYPLLTRLLHIVPAPNDGDITPLLPALKNP